MTAAVSIKNLVKTFGELYAVNELNLEVPEGSIYGFLGPNGSGKTTTLKMLVGMTEPTRGEILIFGNKVHFGSDEFRDEIGFLPDVPGFYDWMTAKEFLDFCGSLFHMKGDTLNEKVKELLATVGLTKSKNKKVSGFSRGMKQRLGIAQALINSPKIILLDEPVSALDPIGRKEVMDIIGSLRGKVTVFFSTHILEDVERICDRVIIIKDGKALLEDSIENIRSMSQTRVIEMDFENGDASSFITQVQGHSWVQAIDFDQKRIQIKVNDLELARNDIFRVIADKKILIKKFAIMEPTLEDIFIKVVNENA